MKFVKTFENYIFGRTEFVEIVNPVSGESRVVKAKIDTETYSSNIDIHLVKELNLNTNIETKRVYNYLGDEELPTADVRLCFNTGNKNASEVDTSITVADRSKLRNQVSIGRKDLERLGILIDVNKSV